MFLKIWRVLSSSYFGTFFASFFVSIFGRFLVRFWGHFGTILGAFWRSKSVIFGIILASFFDYFLDVARACAFDVSR